MLFVIDVCFVCTVVEVHGFEICIYSINLYTCNTLFKYVLKLIFVHACQMPRISYKRRSLLSRSSAERRINENSQRFVTYKRQRKVE